MATPQLENGFLRIATEIVEALPRIRISGEEWQCLWVVFRKTYGWHKKQDHIPLSQFCLATGLKRPNVCRAINKLVSKKILVVIKKETSSISMYRFNKDFESWKPLSKKRHSINIKDTNSKDIFTCFDDFWKAFPKKIAKEAARREWEELDPSKELAEQILKAVEEQKGGTSWNIDNGQFIPHPATWLKQRRWEDEVEIKSKTEDYIFGQPSRQEQEHRRQKDRELEQKIKAESKARQEAIAKIPKGEWEIASQLARDTLNKRYPNLPSFGEKGDLVTTEALRICKARQKRPRKTINGIFNPKEVFEGEVIRCQGGDGV